MVFLKSWREGCDEYLSIVGRKEDDAASGLCFPARLSLRSLVGGAADITKKDFPAKMSLKIDPKEPDAKSRYLLQSVVKTKDELHSTYPLLGRRIIDGDVRWGSYNFRIQGEQIFIPRYLEWTEDVLARFKGILSSASLYSAIYASLYSYDKNLHVMRAFCEGWCPITNTLHTKAGEFSVSLYDLRKLGGLTVVGEIYDETVSPLSTLRAKDANNKYILPSTCEILLEAFYYLDRRSRVRGEVSAEQWINFWCKKEKVYLSREKRRETKNAPKPPHNPNDEIQSRPPDEWTEEEHAVFTKLRIDDSRRTKVYLAAYLSCWLCTFVLPEHPDRLIRPTTFEIASLMAEGRAFSLAIPVLASIYRGLNDIVTCSNPEYAKSFFPAHYLYAWTAHYFSTHHAMEPAPYGPTMARYSLGVKRNDAAGARKLIHEGANVNPRRFTRNRKDCNVLLDNGSLKTFELDYFASMRSSYLCLRLSDAFHVEPYNPHRFSRQFGFCQDIPGLLDCGSSKRNSTRIEALRYWRLILFTGSMVQVHLPSPVLDWQECVTPGFTKWWEVKCPNDLRDNANILIRSTDSDPQKPRKRHLQRDTADQPQEQRRKLQSEVVVVRLDEHAEEDDRNSDGDSEVDPKHDRRGRMKTRAPVTNDLRPDTRIFEGVRSASCMPSQTLEGDLDLELAGIPEEHDLMPLQPNTRPGKGKQLVMLDKSAPLEDCPTPSSHGSQTGSSFAAVDGPPSVERPSLCRRKVQKTSHVPIKPTVLPTCSMTTFRPASPYEGVFEKAVRDVRSTFLTKLKNLSWSKVGEMSMLAKDCYASMRRLQGDPSLLRTQVDSYVSAVNAYLALERQTSKCHQLEDRKLALHQKMEETKLLVDKVKEEHQAETMKLSDTREKIVNLEAQLKLAREEEILLQGSVTSKDETLNLLQTEFQGATRSLEELEDIPVPTAEEQAMIEEQRRDLEEMRASFDTN